MNDDTGPIRPSSVGMRVEGAYPPMYYDYHSGRFHQERQVSYSEDSDMFGDSSPFYLEDPISATLPPPMVLGLNFTEPPRRARHKRPRRPWRRHG